MLNREGEREPGKVQALAHELLEQGRRAIDAARIKGEAYCYQLYESPSVDASQCVLATPGARMTLTHTRMRQERVALEQVSFESRPYPLEGLFSAKEASVVSIPVTLVGLNSLQRDPDCRIQLASFTEEFTFPFGFKRLLPGTTRLFIDQVTLREAAVFAGERLGEFETELEVASPDMQWLNLVGTQWALTRGELVSLSQFDLWKKASEATPYPVLPRLARRGE